MATLLRPCSVSPGCRSSTTSTCSSAGSASGTATRRWPDRSCRRRSRTRRSCRSILFPTGLIDSVQVNKSYSPDRSAEFAGGLVQIVPMKLPAQPVADFSYGLSFYSTATGKSIPLSPLGDRDVWGFDGGARALPAGIPDNKIVRQGIYTPDVGYTPAQIYRVREDAREPVATRRQERQAWAELERNVRQPVQQQARCRRQRDAFLQGAVPRRGSPVLPHRRRGRARGHERLSHADRHPEGAARDRRQHLVSVCAHPAAVAGELLHAQRPGRRPVLRGREPRQRARVPELPPAVHRGRADRERHRRRALLPDALQQPVRLACQLRARHARRARPARDAVRAAARQRGRPCPSRMPTSRRAASTCSTSSPTTRWTPP